MAACLDDGVVVGVGIILCKACVFYFVVLKGSHIVGSPAGHFAMSYRLSLEAEQLTEVTARYRSRRLARRIAVPLNRGQLWLSEMDDFFLP